MKNFADWDWGPIFDIGDGAAVSSQSCTLRLPGRWRLSTEADQWTIATATKTPEKDPEVNVDDLNKPRLIDLE